MEITVKQKSPKVKKIIWLILIGIILLQVLLCVYYGFMKKGFFVDELWGAGLSNSYFRPRLYTPDVFNTNSYLSGSFFRDYLTVSSEQGFSISSVWYNQSQDSHPPLYFLIYHIISCLNTGVFSKWIGIVINLVFFIGCDIFIFLTARKITGYDAAGLIPVILWGFSTEAISYVICARMYMMAAFFIIFLLYETLTYYGLKDNKKFNWKHCILILLITTCGCLTHYYFYIAAFVTALLTCIALCVKKKIKKMLAYGFSVVIGVLLSWAIYPQIFESLSFGDGRGQQTLDNFNAQGGFLSRVKGVIEEITNKLLCEPVFIIAAVISALIIAIIIISAIRRKKLESSVKDQITMLLITELIFGIFMLAAAKIMPYITNRYYFPITPLLWIIVIGNAVLFINVLLQVCNVKELVKKSVLIISLAVVFIIAGAGVLKSHLDGKVMYLYPRQEAILNRIKQMDDPSAIYITGLYEYTLAAHCLELSCCSETLCIDLNSEMGLSDYDIHDESEETVVFIDDMLDQQDILDQLMDLTDYDSYELIGRGSGVGWDDYEELYIYVLTKR